LVKTGEVTTHNLIAGRMGAVAGGADESQGREEDSDGRVSGRVFYSPIQNAGNSQLPAFAIQPGSRG